MNIKTLLLLCLSLSGHARSGGILVSANAPVPVENVNVQVWAVFDGSPAVAMTVCHVEQKRDPDNGEGPKPKQPSRASEKTSAIRAYCEIDQGTHAARFSFSMLGYKTYSVNVDKIIVGNEISTLDLGNLSKWDVGLIRIESIIRSSGPGGANLFQLTFHNKTKNKVLVNKMSLRARTYGACAYSVEPVVNITISDRLTLSYSEIHKATITGAMAVLEDHPEFSVEITGSGVLGPCADKSFQLSAPVNFTLPANDYLRLRILLPPAAPLPVIPKEFLNEEFLNGKLKSVNVQLATSTLFNMFRHFQFVFDTSDENIQQVEGFYDRFSDYLPLKTKKSPNTRQAE